LKPANIMLGKYGETLIVDWGLAKATGRQEDAHNQEVTLHPRLGDGEAITQMAAASGTISSERLLRAGAFPRQKRPGPRQSPHPASTSKEMP
jgi:hypothetical protein